MDKTQSATIYSGSASSGSSIILLSIFFLITNPNHEDDWWVNVGLLIVGLTLVAFGIYVYAHQKYSKKNTAI